MEKLKRRDLWSDKNVHEMLLIVNEKHGLSLMDSKVKRNKTIFEDIALELKKKNIIKTDVQIRNKFKSLKSDFYKIKRGNNKSEAKRQTCEHFELLEKIFGHCPASDAEGVDVVEMDVEYVGVECLTNMSPDIHHAEEDSIVYEDDATAAEGPTSKEKTPSFKRGKKRSYQKVVESFTEDWKKSQQELLQTMKKHDEELAEQQANKMEELLEKNLKGLEAILAKDREETSRMLKEFFNALQSIPPTLPLVDPAPQSTFLESSSNYVPFPKLSPEGNDGIFP